MGGKQKVVMKGPVNDEKGRYRALKAAVGVPGCLSVAIEGADKIVVIGGNNMDPVALTNALRKKLGAADLITVVPVDDKKKDEKKAPVVDKKKVVMKGPVNNEKGRSRALKAAVDVPGCLSVAIEGADEIVVIGNNMDPLALTKALRKKLGVADLITVALVDDKKKDEKKAPVDDKKKDEKKVPVDDKKKDEKKPEEKKDEKK